MAKTPKFYELIDSRIKFKTSDGAYEGDVKTVSISFEKMIVKNCVFLPSETYVGTLFLMFKEVSDVQVIDRAGSKNNCGVSGSKKMNVYHGIRSSKSSEMSIEDFNISSLFSNLPSRIVMISSFGEELSKSINDLKKSPVIGVSLEGPMLGRFGFVNWLCVSSSHATYFFDLQGLGRRVFDLGLRYVLESSSIEKVIHDCRQVSDALLHMFDARLAKVFDTQTADAFVNLQINSGNFHGFVNSLDDCLQRHLKISEDYLPVPAEHASYPDKVKASLIRPPGHLELSVMIKNVIYLRSLKDELKYKMLSPFRRGVDTYLKSVASKSDIQLRHKPYDPVKLPAELIVTDKFGAVEYKNTPFIPISETFNLPYTGQYSFVNKLNELRKQNPYSSVEEIHAKLPKVYTGRGGSHNYPEPVSYQDIDSSNPLGGDSSNELALKSRNTTTGSVLIPEKKMHSSHNKSKVLKTETPKHPISRVSPVTKDCLSGSTSALKNGLAVKNHQHRLEQKPLVTKAETSKSSSLGDSLEMNKPSSSKVRIGNSRILELLRTVHNIVIPDPSSPLPVNNSEVPLPSKENHPPRTSSTIKSEKVAETSEDSSDSSQYSSCSSSPKVRIGNSRILELLRTVHNIVIPDPSSPLTVKNSEVPLPSKENHRPRTSSTIKCEKVAETSEDSSDSSQYEASDYNTVVYNRDGTFFYLPRKKPSSSVDPSNPWSAFKSKYPEQDSAHCKLAPRHKLVPAGGD